MSISRIQIIGRLCVTLLIVALMTGCSSEEVTFTEVKRPGEILKIAELNQFLKVVSQLPDQQLPELPKLFPPVPDWDFDRELSVQGLVEEEQKRNDEPWCSATVLAKLDNNRALKRAIKNQKLTLPQFLGLVETISTAAIRAQYETEEELQKIVRGGQYEIGKLSRQQEVYSRLPIEQQYETLRQAVSITRVHRAQRLLSVPSENVALMRKHLEALDPFLAEETRRDVIHEIDDPLIVYGLPFEESAASGLDAELSWSPENQRARVGHATQKQIAEAKDATISQSLPAEESSLPLN